MESSTLSICFLHPYFLEFPPSRCFFQQKSLLVFLPSQSPRFCFFHRQGLVASFVPMIRLHGHCLLNSITPDFVVPSLQLGLQSFRLSSQDKASRPIEIKTFPPGLHYILEVLLLKPYILNPQPSIAQETTWIYNRHVSNPASKMVSF